jgi:hypothetical protein
MTTRKLAVVSGSSFALFAVAAVAQATGVLQHQSRPTAIQPAAHALIQPLALSVLTRELAEILEDERPLEAAGRSKSFIAGAGFEPATSGL